MLRMSLKFSRWATLLALLSVVLLNAPHADACQNGEAFCARNNDEVTVCAASSASMTRDAEGSGSAPTSVGLFCCCTAHHLMIPASAAAQPALVFVSALESYQIILDPLFATTFERPPKLS